MSWNYRVIEFVDPELVPYWSIHEVFYDEHHKPVSYGEMAAIVQWGVGEDEEIAAKILSMMSRALGLPILIETDFHT